MTRKQRRTTVLVVGLIVVAVSVYLLWPTPPAPTPTPEPPENTASPAHAPVEAANAPLSLEPVAGLTRTGELDLPPEDRVRLVDELIEARLPIEPPDRKVVKQRIKDKSVEQLVERIGDQWAIPHTGGIAPDKTNIVWLAHTFEGNLLVKRLILEGRKDPERVGAMVSADMIKRMSEWFDTCKAYEKEYADRGSAGAAFGHDGTTVGSSAFIKRREDGYAIPAEVFVLMNIDYSKGLDALAELTYRIAKCGIKQEVGPDGKIRTYRDFLWTRLQPGEQFSNDIVYFAAAALIERSTDQKHERLRAQLQRWLTDQPPIYTEIVTDSPEALWPQGGIPFTDYAGIDTSSEPRMTLRMPNFQSDPSVFRHIRGNLQGILYSAHEKTLVPNDPNS
ncbi:MAG TPA: hypothetical protein VMX13_15045 [Sedimentisphaerales bacterium]|nr:hypothetical protein [Sedimentisphaerales bacterium]